MKDEPSYDVPGVGKYHVSFYAPDSIGVTEHGMVSGFYGCCGAGVVTGAYDDSEGAQGALLDVVKRSIKSKKDKLLVQRLALGEREKELRKNGLSSFLD